MNNANWTLLFLVSSDYVAQDVVLLVDTTARMVFAFAILLVIACTIAITFILTASQKRTLAIERKTTTSCPPSTVSWIRKTRSCPPR